jgi:hypothetical protein
VGELDRDLKRMWKLFRIYLKNGKYGLMWQKPHKEFQEKCGAVLKKHFSSKKEMNEEKEMNEKKEKTCDVPVARGVEFVEEGAGSGDDRKMVVTPILEDRAENEPVDTETAVSDAPNTPLETPFECCPHVYTEDGDDGDDDGGDEIAKSGGSAEIVQPGVNASTSAGGPRVEKTKPVKKPSAKGRRKPKSARVENASASGEEEDGVEEDSVEKNESSDGPDVPKDAKDGANVVAPSITETDLVVNVSECAQDEERADDEAPAALDDEDAADASERTITTRVKGSYVHAVESDAMVVVDGGTFPVEGAVPSVITAKSPKTETTGETVWVSDEKKKKTTKRRNNAEAEEEVEAGKKKKKTKKTKKTKTKKSADETAPGGDGDVRMAGEPGVDDEDEPRRFFGGLTEAQLMRMPAYALKA